MSFRDAYGMTISESAMDEVHARVRVLASQIERQTQAVADAEAEVVSQKDALDRLSARFTEWVELANRLSDD